MQAGTRDPASVFARRNNRGMNGAHAHDQDQTTTGPVSGPVSGSVVFAGGGTGGHIFPALAIAESIAADPNTHAVRRIMIGSDKELDRTLLDEAVARGDLDAASEIPARPFGVRPKAAWRLASTWGACVRETRMLLRDERERTGRSPVLVAMGGYVSAAPVKAALAEKCPVVLVNLDAVPGKANRWIAARADARFCVGRSSDLFEPFESGPISPIVRAEVLVRTDAKEARRTLELDPGRPTLLVTGGSQGARTINTFLVAFAHAHADELRDAGWQVLHQSGRDDGRAVAEHYASLGIPAIVAPRIGAMGLAWDAADVSVCRAGAGTVAEAWATGTPSLFLPYPFHKDAHQRANAAILTDRGAGVLGEDRIDTDENLVHNAESLRELLTSHARREAIRDMLALLGPADGANTVAQSVTAMLG